MDEQAGRKIYHDFGAVPVINARGFNLTVLGGGILYPKVRQAMEEANRYYVDMKALLASSGRMIAELMGAEAAYVTTGSCSGMALGTAACIAGKDPGKAARLPDVAGMKHEVIVQKIQRIKYDRCVTLAGGRLVEVGDESGCTPEQIEAAIGDKTVAMLYVGAPTPRPGAVALREVLRVSKRRGIPVIVDAAGQVYPLEKMRMHPALGVDITTHSGKYFGGPNSTGFVCGRRDLIDAVAMHSFIGFEYGPPRTCGRPMKIDRHEVVAIVTALREWMTMDHEQRFKTYRKRAERLQRELQGAPNIETTLYGDPVLGVRVKFDEKALGKNTVEIGEELKAGDPSVWLHWDLELYSQAQEQGSMTFPVKEIVDGDERALADRIKEALS